MQTLIRKILRDLRRRPLRNSLTLLGVIFGVAGVITISATTRSIADAQRLTYDSSNQSDLAGFAGNLNRTTKNLIQRQDNVQVVDSRSIIVAQFSNGGDWQSVRLVGIDSFNEIKLDRYKLVAGQLPARGEVLFDESARALARIKINDVVALRRSPADEISYFKVSGFTRSPAVLGADISNQAIAYTAASAVQSMNGQVADNYLLVRVNDRANMSQTARQIMHILAKRGTTVGELEIRDPGDFIGARELGTVLFLLRIFSILGACLSSLLVANTLSAVIHEDANEIGILRSIGARRWQISVMYLAFSLAMGVTGALAGLALGEFAGWLVSAYLTNLAGLFQPQFVIALPEILLALLVGVAVAVGATIIPTFARSSTSIASLINSHGVHADFELSRLRFFTSPLARLSPTVAIGIRNVVRRPGRTFFTIIVVAVAVAAFVSTSAISDSVTGTVDDLYELYGANGWVLYRTNVDIAFEQQLERMPDVLEAESWTLVTGSIGTTRTDIWGMPVGDSLYEYRLVDGSWLKQSNPPSAIISENLARRIQSSVGDVVVINVRDRLEAMTIVGVVSDSSTYLGATTTGKVFMTRIDLNRLLGAEHRAGLFALKLRSARPADVDQALAEIEKQTAHLGPVTLAAHADRSSAQRAINVLTLLLTSMVVVVAIVGLVGIANTLIINVAERRREFGVMRSVGARSSHIVISLVAEGVTIAAIGLSVGLLVGYPLARLLVQMTSKELFDLTFHLSVKTLVMASIVALLTTSAVSAAPGLVAARLRPMSVLRYE